MTMSQSLLIKKNKTIMSKSPFGIWRKIKKCVNLFSCEEQRSTLWKCAS